jgi:molybdopterin synthase catalytic subunit
MRVRVVPFARIRDIVGSDALVRDAPEGATAGEIWNGLAGEFPALGELALSTRLVRNGAFVDAAVRLNDGDELALLPPYGGG